MTTLLVTTVLRGSAEGDSHGAVFLLDTEGQRAAQVLDWRRPAIDWSGQGGGRGLRGAAFDGERVLLAGADELFVFTPEFELLSAHRCPYLADCRDIAVFERRVYLVSAAFDAVLGFDLDTQRFEWGLHLVEEDGHRGTPFDPNSTLGPSPSSQLQLNTAWCDERGMCISGARSMGMLHFDGRRLKRLVTLPQGVHDARPWRDGVLFNDTDANVVRFMTPEGNRVFQVPKFPDEVLTGLEESAGSRQGFARGLCVLQDGLFASGSSPATVTLHDLDTMKTTLSVNLATDVRHTINSIAVWPFAVPDETA